MRSDFGPMFLLVFLRVDRRVLRRTRRHRARRQNHKHIFPFEFRFALHDCNGRHIDGHAIEQFAPESRIRDLASAKHDRDFDFSTVHQQAFGHAGFGFIVVRLDLGTKFDFLQLPIFLLLTRIFVFLLLLVLQPSVITDLTNRWLSGRRNLDEVETRGSGARERVLGLQNPELLAVLVDDANLADADLVVDTKRSCYGNVS